MATSLLLAVSLAAAAAVQAQNGASNSSASTQSDSSASQDSSKWTLSTAEFNRTSFTRQPFVSNGYIGARLPAEGHGYLAFPITKVAGDKSEGSNGWPLFTPRLTANTVAGFYNHQPNTTGTNFPEIQVGEQPLALIPTWTSFYPTVGNSSYGVDTPSADIINWSQSASINDGLVTTNLTWSSTGNASLNLSYTIYAHRTRPNLGVVRLDMSGLQQGVEVSVTDVLDGAGAWRSNFTNSSIISDRSIFTAVQPNGISNVTAFEVSLVDFLPSDSTASTSPSCFAGLSTNASTISQCYTIAAPSSGKLTFIKYVGIASSDAFDGIEYKTASEAATQAKELGWDALLAEHTAAWDAVWMESDIEIHSEFFDEVQLAVRASLFNIMTNVRNGSEGHGLGDNSIAPAGLTSDSYEGAIFWDAVTWMFPSLLALQPDLAQSVLNFHYRQFGRAQENAKDYNVSGALYPWIAGRFGNCTGVGPCYDYEYHYNNDIALGMYQYYAATGNKTFLEEEAFPVIRAVAEFWASFVQLNETTGLYETFNMTGPNEYSNHVNNEAFTNAGLSVVLNQAIELAEILNVTVPSNWSEIASNITILETPGGIVIESGGFNSTSPVKQADVVLLIYPLEYEEDASALVDLDYYAGATSASGPGMTYSVFSVDESQLATSGCAAYTYMLAASQPYSREPYYQFSEQTGDVYASNGGTNPAFTFLTGHGGFLQVWTHGWTGYRSRIQGLYFDPSLPPQLSNYTVKGLSWGGSRFNVNLNTDETTITHVSGSKAVNVEISKQNPGKAGNHTLAVGESLVVPTRSTDGTLIEGNYAQCAQAISEDVSFANRESLTVPGQFALAAIDGSNATTWQPATNASSTLAVDLIDAKNLSAFHINWGNNPAISYSISAGSSLTNQTVVASGNVTISAAYDAATAQIIEVKAGNTTDVKLNAPVVARYVNVTIQGSFGGDGPGGTIAEFAALG